MEYPNNEGLHKKSLFSILLIVIFSGITILQIINILTPRPTGFLFDIYGCFSLFYWMLILGIIILCGFALTYFSLYDSNNKSSFLFIFALALTTSMLFLQNKILFFSTGQGDPLTHLGYVSDIVSSHYILLNPYPFSHLLIGSFSELLSCPTIVIMNFFPFLFFLMYIISMYTLGRTFLRENPFFYFFIGLAFLPLFGFQQDQFWPNMTFLFLTPFIFYLLLKINGQHYKEFFLIWVLLLFVIFFGHQLYSMIWLLLFSIIFIVYFYYMKFLKQDLNPFLLIFSFILGSVLFYYISFIGVNDILLYSYHILFGGSVLTPGDAAELTTQVAKINPQSSILILIRRALFGYGSLAILGAISGLIFLYMAVSYLVYHIRFHYIFVLTSICGFFCYLFAIINMLFFDFESVRVYSMGHIFTIILIPFFLLDVIKNFSSRKIVKIIPYKKILLFSILILLLGGLSLISVFTVHSSFYFSNFGNEQVTESSFNSITTFYKYRDSIFPIVQNGIAIERFEHTLFGMISAKTGIIREHLQTTDFQHYNHFDTFGQRYPSGSYFIFRITPVFHGLLKLPFNENSNEYFYDLKSGSSVADNPKVRERLNYYSNLESDRSLNRIFSNAPIYIYIVN